MRERARNAVPEYAVRILLILKIPKYINLEKKLTNFSDNSTNDQLLLASGPDSSPEIGIIPCINLTLTTDEGSIGMHIRDLFEKEAVRTGIGGAGQDGGQVEDLSQGGMGQHVVAEVIGAEITDDLRETDLVINDQKSLGKR